MLSLHEGVNSPPGTSQVEKCLPERNLAISACMQHSRGIPGDNACIAGVDVRILLREYPEKFLPGESARIAGGSARKGG